MIKHIHEITGASIGQPIKKIVKDKRGFSRKANGLIPDLEIGNNCYECESLEQEIGIILNKIYNYRNLAPDRKPMLIIPDIVKLVKDAGWDCMVIPLENFE
jgi:hypothetical protein